MLGFKRKKADTNMLVAQERQFIINKDTDFFIQEAYNTLRSNVNFSLTDEGCKVIAVTSTSPSEGKSITALNLAIAFSQVDKKVVLFDCDLRKPKIYRLLEIDPKPGISNLLIKECRIEDTIRHIDKYNIDVICSGDIPPNSTKLLESPRFEKLLLDLREKYDIIIIDTPPVNTVVDACIIAKYTSGIVYVIKSDYTKKDLLVNSVRQLEYAKGKVIGFVLNNITDKTLLSFTYRYRYKYRYKYRNAYKYGYAYREREDSGSDSKEKDNKSAKKNKKAKD